MHGKLKTVKWGGGEEMRNGKERSREKGIVWGVNASNGATPGRATGWKIHRPGTSSGSALPSSAYCFASIL